MFLKPDDFVRILGVRYTNRDCFCFVQVHREPGVFVLFPEEHLRLGPLCRLLVLPADSSDQCLQIEKARLLILKTVHCKFYFLGAVHVMQLRGPFAKCKDIG